jgi:hypothetical protein
MISSWGTSSAFEPHPQPLSYKESGGVDAASFEDTFHWQLRRVGLPSPRRRGAGGEVNGQFRLLFV